MPEGVPLPRQADGKQGAVPCSMARRCVEEPGPWVLMGEAPTAEDRVRAAMVQAGIGGAVSQLIVGGLDDETLRAELLRTARRMFDLS